RPQYTPLFPYTTLFRSHLLHGLQRTRARDVEDREGREVEEASALAHREVLRVDDRRPPSRLPFGRSPRDAIAELVEQPQVRLVRSEEHTSELQSPCNLV